MWVINGADAPASIATYADNPNGGGAPIADLTAVDGEVFYFAGPLAFHDQLWRTDGTNKGTELVADLPSYGVGIASVPPEPLDGTAVATLSATEGAQFTATVAKFTDPNPVGSSATYDATIDWGDSSSESDGTITGPDADGTFTVTGTHTYAEETRTPEIVSVVLSRTGAEDAAVSDAVNVGDAPLSVTGRSLTASANAALTGALATFADTGGPEPLADYSATIDWGDGGSATAAVISGPDANGVFTINGSHTYTAAGTPTVTITVHHDAVTPDAVVKDAVSVSGPVSYASPGGAVTVKLVNGDLEVLARTTVASSTPLDDVSSLTVTGATGVANSFTLDYTGGTFVVPGGITFNGGTLPATPSNSLSILGGSFDVDTFDFQGAHDGSIQLGTSGQLVTYTNMTPLVNTGTAAQAVFKLPDGTVTASLDAGQAAGTVELVSGNGSFETTTFPAPAQSLTVNSGNGSDTVTTTNAFYNNFNAVLTVQGAANTLPLHVSGTSTLTATAGAAFTDALATFTDPNGAGPLSGYSASINWGDSTTADNGSITLNAGVFTVSGTHTYTEQGTESPAITITHGSAAPVTATASVDVSDAALVATPATLTATAGSSQTFSVATFTDPGGAQPVSDYSATINWGDNTTTDNGTIALNSGVFTVSGTHTYAAAGTMSAVVTIDHGSAAPVTTTAAVVVTSAVSFATSDAVYTIGSGTVSVSAADGLLKNDTGPTQLSVTAGTFTGAQGGTFAFNADGSFTYTPGANFPGYDSAPFTVSDASGDKATQTVTVLSQHAAVVWKFYESVLNRTPDAAGLQYWTGYFNNGGNTGDMAFGFFESDELLDKVLGNYYEQY
ncbi:MAG TPA: Ig-like domain-containing protein, partial [Pirellulales bacterium]|nr:Ig-like domain-containing protein [Pirellulales bacterium]